MPITAPTKPKRPKPPVDPLAAGLGNASFLGVGYAMLGRWWLTILTTLVTVVLVVLLATSVRTLWFEILVVVWWVAVIAHGWVLARRGQRPERVRRQRLVGLAFALPVVLAVGLLRFDAAGIYQDVADARADGDCARALSALDGRWFGHHVADAPLSAKGDDTVRACDLLRQAGNNLDTALSGDVEALRTGMARLNTVLQDLPGHEEMVGRTLDRFLDGLPTDDACDTRVLTDWLGRANDNGTVLDRAADVVPEIAPEVIVECGDEMMAENNWTVAKERYQQLLDEYPDHDLAGRAQEGVTKATQAIELANVTQLLTPPYTGASPDYCTKPAPYSGAVAYGATRPNRALFYGNDEYTNRLPAEWKATGPADAVLVICAGATEYGPPVETCPYESTLSPFGYTDVTFKKISIPVRVFEVKTARVVIDVRVEISGASCPAILEYTSYGTVDLGPPSEVYVTPSDPEVHAGFNSLVNP
jgi:hypothetical protein